MEGIRVNKQLVWLYTEYLNAVHKGYKYRSLPFLMDKLRDINKITGCGIDIDSKEYCSAKDIINSKLWKVLE